ncbi:MAG: SGNH/GDSL hydrolase family protein [Candidatus Glassbacteria bacterium]
MCKRCLFVFHLLLSVTTATAFGQADFTDTVTFGNSLTHNDLLWLVYGNPPDLYGMDPMEAVFNKGAVTGDELTNYAIAGSESDDISLQIDLYEFLRILQIQDKATLFSFEIGANDILNNISLLSANAPGEDPSADAVINNVINDMLQDLLRLRSSHMDAQFIVWTIPDVTLTPDLWNELSPDEIDNVQAHIERVNRLIRLAGNRFQFVIAFDLYWLIQQIVANPPAIFGHQLVPPPDYGDYDNLFADEIHPTAVSNALIADVIIMEINSKWNDTVPLYSLEELADLAHIPY